MKSQGYSVATVPATSKTTLHRALAAGAGVTEGDILSLTEILNTTTGLTISSYWRNEDTNTLIVTPVNADVEALDSLRVVVGSEILPFTAVAAALATVPANANGAELHVFSGDVIYNYDGTAPDEVTFDGYRENDGGTFELEGRQEILNFQVKGIGLATGNVKVTYVKNYSLNV